MAVEHIDTQAAHGSAAVLSVTDLSIGLAGGRGRSLVEEVAFSVAPRQTLAIIGESGSCKTLSGLAILGLLPPNLEVRSGRIEFQGRDVLDVHDGRKIHGRGGIAAVFQDPMNSLNPTMRVGDQIGESRRLHLGESASQARASAIELLERVGLDHPEARARQYPFELSGGMQQRVMIAAALASEPALIIADEPTTALDVTVQAEILSLLLMLQERDGLAVVLITHDLGVVAAASDTVAVMHAGHVVETGTVSEVLHAPVHPYTNALIGAMPTPDAWRQRLTTIPKRVPLPGEFGEGCRFRTRCPYRVEAECDVYVPMQTWDGRYVRCARLEAVSVEIGRSRQ